MNLAKESIFAIVFSLSFFACAGKVLVPIEHKIFSTKEMDCEMLTSVSFMCKLPYGGKLKDFFFVGKGKVEEDSYLLDQCKRNALLDLK